ncbi:hypothetical protein D9M69_494720 [compost metagenome]
MVEPCGEGEFAVEQRAGVRVVGELGIQGFERNVGLGVTELFAQQVAGPVHRAHSTDPEQALDAVALAEYLRQILGLRPRGAGRRDVGHDGEIGADGLDGAGWRHGATHRLITTALRLSRAGPCKASSNRRCRASWALGRINAALSSSSERSW